jgi:hypothetical protein
MGLAYLSFADESSEEEGNKHESNRTKVLVDNDM